MENKMLVLLLLVLLLVMLRYYLKKKKPLRHMLFGVLTGVAALVLLNLYGYNIGYTAQINAMTISVSAILGVPGVILIYLTGILL